MQILSLQGDTSHFYLSEGQAYINFFAPDESVMQFDTPDSTIRVFDRATFRTDVSDQYRYTDVSVYDGEVQTENGSGQTTVPSGNLISMGADTDGELAELGPPDAWEQWNRRRDSIFARVGESTRYLPPELDTYSYDLDNNGRWVNTPDYGYCWTPTDVGPGWAPYRFGRWVWTGGVQTWVSDDPWGWAPYHYGRWFFAAGTGWCWVPPAPGAVYWGPGYVGWVVTPGYVGWVPLAPREVYYGYGYYGPRSVNVTNMAVTQVNVTRVYQNVYVNGGTVVTRNTFATASPRIVRMDPRTVQRQVFTINNVRSINSVIERKTVLRPTSKSVVLSARPVPATKLPPARVRTVQVTRLKESRPLVKSPGRSVWNPGENARRLEVRTVPTARTPLKTVPALRRSIPSVTGRPSTQNREITPGNEQRRGTFERTNPGANPAQGERKNVLPGNSGGINERRGTYTGPTGGRATLRREFGPASTPRLRQGVLPEGAGRGGFVPQGRTAIKKPAPGGRAPQKGKKEEKRRRPKGQEGTETR